MESETQKPSHIVITPDWNRRWAKKNGVEKIEWHIAWYKKIKEVIWWANDRVIECLTVWWLSKTNVIKRDKNEIKWILKIVNELSKLLPLLQKNNIKFINIGDIKIFPALTQWLLNSIQEKTKDNTWMKLVIALGYSWLDDNIRAIRKILLAGLNPNEIDELKFKEFLDWGLEIPDPDLNIRTWIHNWTLCTRHSWIYLPRATDMEHINHQVLWPDYTEKQFDEDLLQFSKTERTKWWNK